VGAGAMVIRAINVPVIGMITIKAQAQAFVVQESGVTGPDLHSITNDPRPVFRPTYWVKLAGSK